ncbi:glycosyltransferase involved in cell wall biosynthesis [Inhella inkyongensis]|uniref:Glycosyltransferase involved in cell wall biosynthesis n=1 Tax=Inhella inkyongensis TaxID=392593 RepID=A0A840S224_9BURK|nr:glycosyltransferase [Inhella inkyongensis]MBB5204355.1 glycosyltransferase involved in cell wall biosynthesis [Inhella inkyongensis]
MFTEPTSIPGSPPQRFLYSTAETHPCTRADVAVLFGKYLPRFGVQTDLVGVHVSHAPPPWPGGARWTLRGAARGARRHGVSVLADFRMLWLARRGYAGVIVRDKVVGALFGLLAARLAGVPFFYWMSFPMVEAWALFVRQRRGQVGWLRWLAAQLRATLLRGLLYRVILPRADHLFAQSEVMVGQLRAKGLAGERISAVPMGVDVELLNRVEAAGEEAAEPSMQTPVFAYLGTLNRLRGPELMIEALALLRERGVDARLLLIGDAEEEADRRWLREQIQRHGLEQQVEITGWLPTQEGWRRCATAVAGLSPFPRTELLESASPTKLVEYFFLGLPVIANDQPDQAALMRAAGGTCAQLSAEGFAGAMQALLAQPEAHRAIAAAGRAWVLRTRSYAGLAQQVAQQLGACVRRP